MNRNTSIKIFLIILCILISVSANGWVHRQGFDTDEQYEANGGDILDPGVNDFCGSAWVYLDSYLASTSIFDKLYSEPYYVFGYNAANGKASLIFNDGTGWIETNATNAQPIGEWHHIVFTADRDGVCTFYLDGVANGTADISGKQGDIDSVNAFKIAGHWGDRGDMKFSDVKIYIGGLWTPTQVLYQKNNPLDLSVSSGTITDAWSCKDSGDDTVVVGANNNLTANANTNTFSLLGWITR